MQAQQLILPISLRIRGLLNEVILSILNQASDRPIVERADSARVNIYLKRELEGNGLEVPLP